MSLYTGFVNVADHIFPFDACALSSAVKTTPSSFRFNVTESGLFPAALLLSSHTFVTVIIFASVGLLNVFVKLYVLFPLASTLGSFWAVVDL